MKILVRRLGLVWISSSLSSPSSTLLLAPLSSTLPVLYNLVDFFIFTGPPDKEAVGGAPNRIRLFIVIIWFILP